MGATTEAPADTRVMAIVHAALRRDLERTRAALLATPAPQGRQRVALGEHVGWLMDFLHRHHAGEDAGLWPLVRRRNPAASELLDSLEADHRRVQPAAQALTDAGRRYATTRGDDTRAALVDALDALTAVLLPHLDREVAEAMPVVAASITEREWQAWDKQHVKKRSPRQLGMEGHWLLDGLDPEGRTVVTGLVPPVPRFVLLHGFAGPYRRYTRRVWQADVPRQRPPTR